MSETATISATSPGRDASKAGGAAASAKVSNAGPSTTAAERAPPQKPPLNQIYALPAPIRTFPLPTFYPNNPISLLHLVYAWLSQVFRPPAREPSVIHTGVWDPETRSVHVKDETSIRALWEQGFYGKGSLSRSEPNWLKRELARRGSPEGKTVSEARTELRREERRLAKWERAKAELEAIERQRLAEAAAQAVKSETAKAAEALDELVNGEESPSSPDQPAVVEPTPADSVAELVSDTVPVAESTEAVKPEVPLARRLLHHKPPVGPAELLALPNSLAQLNGLPNGFASKQPQQGRSDEWKAPVGPAELLLLPNSHADIISKPVSGLAVFEMGSGALSQPLVQPTLGATASSSDNALDDQPELNGAVNGHAVKASASVESNPQVDKVLSKEARPDVRSNGVVPPPSLPSDESVSSSVQDTEVNGEPPFKRRKSVRFSPTVESTTFLHSDPPSPNRSLGAQSKSSAPSVLNGKSGLAPETTSTGLTAPSPLPETSSDLVPDVPVAPIELVDIENKEHFQLSPEEAFFLVFALGALKVVDPVTNSPISTEHLLSLFRSYSYFPPRPAGAPLSPDDPFLVNYAVYHHFRSLGWVPRHGIKFGVDWIIYQRGPVFDHSEFGIMVMPSYSDPVWKGYEHGEPKRSWSWLMGVNRVLSHVLKSLVLVYVDIPPPTVFEEEMRRGGIAAALKRYTIREVMVRRFSVNRNR